MPRLVLESIPPYPVDSTGTSIFESLKPSLALPMSVFGVRSCHACLFFCWLLASVRFFLSSAAGGGLLCNPPSLAVVEIY